MICTELAESGITTPFPIQELTLPLALKGADLIGQARTGTGKTLAFGIPLLQRLDLGEGTQALVIVPTRELCLQVADDLANASARKGVRVAAVYGGKAIDPQVEAIAKGAEIVVGTPGRLLDLMRRRKLDLSTVTGLVLDEADEMLDLGFLPDVEQLIQATAPDRQTLLFSATMPSAVVALARRYMHKPTYLRADVEQVHIAPETRQHFFSCHRMDKPAVLARILQTPNRGLCLVFTRTKRMADILAEELRERGISAAAIHSDLRQDARERTLARFRTGRVDVLVATEVAARGLDIAEVTHVVNYDCPEDEKMYLHRIGRTGRAGAAGVAVTLAVWNELARLDMIRRSLDIDEPVHEVFSTSGILDELFDLPERQRRAMATAPNTAHEQPAARETPAAPARSKARRRSRTIAEEPTAAEAKAAEEPAAAVRGPGETSPIIVETGAAAAAQPSRRRTRQRNRTSRQASTSSGAPPRAPSRPESTPVGARAEVGSGQGDDHPGDELRKVRVRRRADRQRPPKDGRDAATMIGGISPDSSSVVGGVPSDPLTPEATRPVQSRNGQRSETRTGVPQRNRRGTRRAPASDSRQRARVRQSGRSPEEPHVDIDAARGGGHPLLRRALLITHLP
ncbi:MAG: DEAD/DEAH box helicase [Egibacteraceae bacterium]